MAEFENTSPDLDAQRICLTKTYLDEEGSVIETRESEWPYGVLPAHRAGAYVFSGPAGTQSVDIDVRVGRWMPAPPDREINISDSEVDTDEAGNVVIRAHVTLKGDEFDAGEVRFTAVFRDSDDGVAGGFTEARQLPIDGEIELVDASFNRPPPASADVYVEPAAPMAESSACVEP